MQNALPGGATDLGAASKKHPHSPMALVQTKETQMPTSTSATLRQARRLLMDRGELPAAGLVEPVVARSWRRCLDAGLVPASPLPDAPQLDARAVLRAIERQRELVAHARPVM